MTIVCGTDFSQHAREASNVAAALARRLGESLTLVHVIDELGAELAVETRDDAIYEPLRARLQADATELADRFQLVVEPLAIAGIAHRKLLELAELGQASLIVVASLSQQQHWWSLGTVAERVAQTSPVPTLIVRQPERLLEWLNGERVLRTLVGAEPGSTSRGALEFAAGLRAANRCDLFVTQIAWPAGEHYRFGVPAPTPIDHLRPELEQLLLRDLRAWAGELPGAGETHYLVRPGIGRIDTHLALVAEEENADLLVVETHQRSALARLWQASVSRGVLHNSRTNVLTVPGSGPDASEPGIVSFENVLVCTDFSELSMRGIRTGYGLVAPGGSVHLLYVRTGQDKSEHRTLTERLETLIPPGVTSRGVNTEVEVVDDDVASLGICRTAKRLGADAICMATHGRGGLSKLLVGSQAQEVLQRSEVPVVLVPPPGPRSL